MANVATLASAALSESNGIFRLAPNWVPRSFLQPGRRLKLNPNHYYALGMNRGGIDERWFGSTTEAANDNRNRDEGLSYCVTPNGEKFQLKEAVDELKGEIIGDAIWDKYGKWPVYSKFFDNMGPIPHHMHQNAEQAKLVGQEGKPPGNGCVQESVNGQIAGCVLTHLVFTGNRFSGASRRTLRKASKWL